jgi:ferredoxin
MTARLEIDWTRCDGHRLCAELLPEFIKSDEWGFPIIRSVPVPENLIIDARRAVWACPSLALRLESTRS